MLTLLEALQDLADRNQKQIAETLWSIERIKPMSQKELEEWQGKSAQKKNVEQVLEKELKERQENLACVLKLIKKYD